ncbi:hypothetical protein PGT21_014538 [Puccinia graminis f. sp. tritici]|uniref:Uncharacterized protein n=1 Tax=Puccinia graminis f. sp. tritici TaxID=56615 RepID=A0A5B0P2G8_PUCGR|nr:hypothetical protein PGTUg99_022478 [Puccinia graminis f. sp. tritici]KAA1094239.1 hypothetical protein PGT21_014538 [Puccinia graminis f. sp. tritici]
MKASEISEIETVGHSGQATLSGQNLAEEKLPTRISSANYDFNNKKDVRLYWNSQFKILKSSNTKRDFESFKTKLKNKKRLQIERLSDQISRHFINIEISEILHDIRCGSK